VLRGGGRRWWRQEAGLHIFWKKVRENLSRLSFNEFKLVTRINPNYHNPHCIVHTCNWCWCLRASGDLLRASVNPDVFCSCSQSGGSASFNHVFSLSPAFLPGFDINYSPTLLLSLIIIIEVLQCIKEAHYTASGKKESTVFAIAHYQKISNWPSAHVQHRCENLRTRSGLPFISPVVA